MEKVIQEWYEDKKNVDEMFDWNKANNKIKIWEQEVIKVFPEKASILDIGCGKGREAFALSDMNFSVVGIDISEEVINQVTKSSAQNGYSISFQVYDGHSLPFDDESFQVIIIWSQTFGLLQGDNYKQEFLKECKRVLKKDGILSFSGHDARYLQEHYMQYINGRKFYPYANAEIYWETFLPEELSDYAKNAGFSVILCEEGEIYKPEDGVVLHCLCKK
ncbi:methyltransferase domain-containing protein [Anaerosporobacter sp.]|uniref:methyltransferase domain-containing protein n=1 Tax=Anaerosporobacter sp. TaxID=1872529 RepID=UPI00286EC70C|nr:methyltransferase domain-containing protein [Anaerosporobacter sp.]